MKPLSEKTKNGAVRYGMRNACAYAQEYENDGGDKVHAKNAVMNPGHVDEALWAKAKRASQEAFGEIRYPFVSWWYQKQGGKFG